MVKAPTPMGNQVEVEWELLGSDPCFQRCCPHQRFLTADLLPFPILSPLRDNLLLLRVPLGSSPSTDTSESRRAEEPWKDDTPGGTRQWHKITGRQQTAQG